MLGKESVVFVIDGDPSFCRSTKLLLESAGFSVQTFGSAEDF
jgi:FixJ family two-component response regulator